MIINGNHFFVIYDVFTIKHINPEDAPLFTSHLSSYCEKVRLSKITFSAVI